MLKVQTDFKKQCDVNRVEQNNEKSSKRIRDRKTEGEGALAQVKNRLEPRVR